MRDGRARTAVELIKTADIAECYLNFFSNIRQPAPAATIRERSHVAGHRRHYSESARI